MPPTTVEDKAEAEALKEQGNKLFRELKYADALKLYQKATRKDPCNAKIYSNQAVCCQKLGDFKGMKKAAAKAIDADASFVRAYYRKAFAQKELDEEAEALETAIRGLEILETSSKNSMSEDQAKSLQSDFKLLKTALEVKIRDSKCHNCGKPESKECVLHKCAQCKQVKYCSRECQREHWKAEHKRHCDKALGANPMLCGGCKKTLFRHPLRCSRCHAALYCSRECQRNEWPEHRKWCCKLKENRPASEDDAFKLLHHWLQQRTLELYMLQASVLTREEFMEQPPSVVLKLQVEFSYNLASFTPVAPPVKVAIRDLSGELRERAQKGLMNQEESRREGETYSHCIIVTTSILMKQHSLIPGLLTPEYFVNRKSIDCVMDCLMTSCEVNRDYFSRHWKAAFQKHCQSQIEFFLMAGGDRRADTMDFLYEAFQLKTSNPLDKSHALFFMVDFGLELGAIRSVNSFEVLSIKGKDDLEGAKTGDFHAWLVDYARKNLRVVSDDSDQKRQLIRQFIGEGNEWMVVELPVFFVDKLGQQILGQSVPIDLREPTRSTSRTKKECIKAAQVMFKKLQSTCFPVVEGSDARPDMTDLCSHLKI